MAPAFASAACERLPVILRELVEREPTGSWWAFLEQLAQENTEVSTLETAPPGVAAWPDQTDKKDAQRKIEERQRAERWQELMARMRRVRADVGSAPPEGPTCDECSRSARHVARYSFEAGRIVSVESDAIADRTAAF